MNKKLLLCLVSSITLATSIAAIAVTNNGLYNSFVSGGDKPASLDCSYYFDSENGYTSLYDLNCSRLNDGADINNAKTWGTVTCIYYNGSTESAFIQSTDRYGNVGATCLYDISLDDEIKDKFVVGSVVTVTGKMTLFNGMSEMKNCSIEVDYATNPNPVEEYEITSLPSKTDPDFNTLRYMGTRLVHLSDVTVGSVTSGRQAYATFPNGEDTCLLFFNSISNKTAIVNKINQAHTNESTLDITGYVTCFDNNDAGTNPSLQVLLRSQDDIVDKTPKSLTMIEVSTSKSFYYGQTLKINDFDVLAHYSDGSSAYVDGAFFDGDTSTYSLGQKQVRIGYQYGTTTIYSTCMINILDRIYEIRAYLPEQYYTQGDAFIEPTVYGSMANQDIEITDDVEFSGFDSYQMEGTKYTGRVDIDYTNSLGENLTTSYEYYVSDVVSLQCDSYNIQFYEGEEYDFPAVYGYFAIDDTFGVNVTPRVTYSGFDSSEVGEQLITITYGSFELTYWIEILPNSDISYFDISNIKTDYELGDLFIKPTVIAYFDNGTHKDVTDLAEFSGFNPSKLGKQSISVSYLGYTEYFEVEVSPGAGYLKQTLDTISWGKYYETGNWGSSGDFEYYRAIKASGKLACLLPLDEQYISTLPGSIYNTSAIKDIDYVIVNYFTEDSGGSRSPRLYYGENDYSQYESLAYSTSLTSTTIDLSSENVNYIKLDGGDTSLTVSTVEVYYTGDNTPNGSSLNITGANNNEYRIAPVTYSGTLIDGSSYVDIPISFDTSTNTVLATKRYTYYSYDYVYEHPDVKDQAAMVDPVDVCNYFSAFGCAPANYGAQNTVDPLKDGNDIPSKSQVNYLFGSDARCISQYSKTTGYATSVPYYGIKPTYFELDIDVDGQYSVYDRQTGRIVAWYTGFQGSDYGNGSQIVCDYTDDHYFTFAEFNNFGGFMPRFNVEGGPVCKEWSNPTTITSYTFA